jgi:hypothetical protein
VTRESQAAYRLASFQLTLITGIFPRPHRSGTRGHALAATQASHSSNVASNFETAIGLAILTSCRGRSFARASASTSGEPMLKRPAEITIIAGQPLAHSLNSAPDFSAFAFSCPAASALAHLEAVSSGAFLGDGPMIDEAQARNIKAGRKYDRQSRAAAPLIRRRSAWSHLAAKSPSESVIARDSIR